MTQARPLPHNLDAEASVLGGIVLRNEHLAELDTLEIDDFYHHQHKVVFEAMRNLEARSQPIDVVTLDAEIQRRGKSAAVGGIAFLGELALRVPTADNVIAYAAIVQAKRRARDLIIAASEIVETGYADNLDIEEYLGDAVAAVTKCDRGRPQRARRAGEMVKARIKELEDRAAAKARGEVIHNGIPTGIAELDAAIGGYPFGDLVILAARPGMGKTAMAMSAVDAATEVGFGAHVFSSEGGWRMMADRMIARAGRVPVSRLRSADLRVEDFAGVNRAAAKYHFRPNWLIDDTPGLTAQEIIRRVRRERREIKTRLVVVDYIQILRRTRGLDENAALDEIATLFAQAAIDDDITYLVLSQFNREVEKRADKVPTLSDLRGSGALEERPRVVVSPYRGAYYRNEPLDGVDYDCSCVGVGRGAPCTCAPTEEAFKKLVKVLLLKNSNAATGHVWATWNGEYTEMT
jgi:replicative DNA helicase